jgi:glyoxylase-like metal-dependent hydrolase (beta-lactamase superfamily II)
MAAQPAAQHSIDVGDIRLTYLPDGEGHLVPTGALPDSTEEAWQQAHQQLLDDNGRVVTTFGGFLVETGDRKVIVDLGFGDQSAEFPDFATLKGGRFLDSLKQTEVDPADIDTVLYTHLHVDHVGWTSRAEGSGRALTFPNARHLASGAEWQHWSKPDESGVGPDPDAVLNPLQSRLEEVADGHTVAPGVTVRSTPGHTPGHQSVVISSGSARAIIVGDVLWCPAQIPQSEWNVVFDVDPGLARRTREAFLAEVEQSETILACSHFSEAVFGRVLTGEGKRMWSTA